MMQIFIYLLFLDFTQQIDDRQIDTLLILQGKLLCCSIIIKSKKIVQSTINNKSVAQLNKCAIWQHIS